MTDQTAAELNVSGDDDPDVARRTVGTPSGDGHVQFSSSIRTAERSSGLSDSDDPPGVPKSEDPDPEERTVTRAGARLIQSAQGMIGVICLATQALITSILVNVFYFYLQKKGQ
jgi:hypothetical protein